VQTLNEDPIVIDAARQRLLSDTLTLANQLGATVFTLKGEDIADTLARFAAEYRVGHILLGKPHPRPWWQRIMRRKDIVSGLLGKTSGSTLILIDTRTGAPASAAEEIQEPVSRAPGPQPADRLKLSDFLRADQILIWDEPVSKSQVMQDLLKTLLRTHPGLDLEMLSQRLQERESQGSTFLNEGVALPHARIENLEKPLVALGLSHGGILDAYTENPIEVVFLLLSPKIENRSHLQLLAVAGRMMLNRTLRNQLRKERKPEEVFRKLREFENPE